MRAKPLSLDAEAVFIHNDKFERVKKTIQERWGDTLVCILEWARDRYQDDKEFKKWLEKEL